MSYRNMEEVVYGPNGERAKGAITACEEAIRLAKANGVRIIEIEIRKQLPGETSGQEGTERVPADTEIEVFAAALLKRLQSAPGDDFRGTLRLNFREAGRSSNHLTSFERKCEGRTIAGEATGGASGMVPAALYTAALEDSRRMSDAAVRLVGGVVVVIEKVGTLLGNMAGKAEPPPQLNSGRTDLLLKTLGVVAAGAADPKAGAAAAANVISEELRAAPLPTSDGKPPPPSSTTSAGDAVPPSSSSSTVTEAQAEAWARANPDQARAMAMRLMQSM